MEIKKLTNADAGCIYDSHHGHYIIPFVIGYAHEAGRPTDPFVMWAVATYLDANHNEEYPHEALIEESDAAIVWLNDHVAPDDLYFDWHEGDFGLYRYCNEGEWMDPEEFAQSAKKDEED